MLRCLQRIPSCLVHPARYNEDVYGCAPGDLRTVHLKKTACSYFSVAAGQQKQPATNNSICEGVEIIPKSIGKTN